MEDSKRYKDVDQEPNGEYEQLKLLSAQFLLFSTLVLSLITTFGTTWIIFRLRLTNDLKVMKLHRTNNNNDELLFNQDLITGTLLPQEELRMREIIGGRIEISGLAEQRPPPITAQETEQQQQQQQAEISIDQESISMQAESFGSAKGGDYSFSLSSRLDVLEVARGIRNVKVIRAPSSKSSLSSRSKQPHGSLEVYSPDKLELSGNMGLKVLARNDLHLSSPESSIDIKSLEEPIVLMGSKGLRLISIQHESGHQSTNGGADSSASPPPPSQLNSSPVGEPDFSSEDDQQRAYNKYQLCIHRNDGRIFQAPLGSAC